MAKEIEKKYLVKEIPSGNYISRSNVFQGYLQTGIDYEVRISNRLHLTVKSGQGLVREEKIYDISNDVYQALLPLTEGKRVEKMRFNYELKDGLVAELDVYSGENKGLMTVEVEFESEEQANNFVPPYWFGDDVSHVLAYKNSILAK